MMSSSAVRAVAQLDSRLWRLRAGVLLAFGLSAPLSLTAQHTDSIRGRLLDALDQPITHGTIVLEDTVADLRKVTSPDSAGRFVILLTGGSGAYVLTVTALGYAPQHLALVRGANGTIAFQTLRMVSIAAVMGAIRTVGRRMRP